MNWIKSIMAQLGRLTGNKNLTDQELHQALVEAEQLADLQKSGGGEDDEFYKNKIAELERKNAALTTENETLTTEKQTLLSEKATLTTEKAGLETKVTELEAKAAAVHTKSASDTTPPDDGKGESYLQSSANVAAAKIRNNRKKYSSLLNDKD